jgi:RNA polymerase sigma-70 factor (ECF subfamily)
MLGDAFLAALASDRREVFARWPELGSRLRQMWSEARDAWPGLPDRPGPFIEHMAAHVDNDANPEQALETIRVADLYLAWASGEGDTGAIEALKRTMSKSVDESLARFARDGSDFVSEARERAWGKILVRGPGSRPKIYEYAGRGKLQGWIRITVLRTALSLRRKSKGGSKEEPVAEMARAHGDPELLLMKALYRDKFRTSLKAALASLPPEERNMLRHHLLDGLSVDRLGALYGFSRATAARRVARAKALLLERTRSELARIVGISQEEIDTILRLIQSDVDLSVATFFGDCDRTK